LQECLIDTQCDFVPGGECAADAVLLQKLLGEVVGHGELRSPITYARARDAHGEISEEARWRSRLRVAD
jgi:hypothetical protein